ncbi:MAG: aminodeoxychorismate/anthranilate synthase component I, partial [Blautia producta]|nr:aminodeoxychorismate/anthranilate synthase component I [Blautia producta]
MRTKIHKLNFYVKSEDIFEQFKNRKMAVFLDSSLENQLGQFSIIGLEPYLILKEEDGVFYK